MGRLGSGSSHFTSAAAGTHDAERVMRIGRLLVLVTLVPAALWLSLAPITAAVVAPGLVRVDLNRRPVQHREGGIVKTVLVRDGQRVAAGQPVLLLGDVGVQADRNRLDFRAKVLRASLARLQAEELRAADLVFPPELQAAALSDERLQEGLVRERALFDARRATLHSELALMRAQRERIEHECLALRRQIAQMRAALERRQRNLEANRRLQEDGYISVVRITQIEAETAEYAASLEMRGADLARATQRQGDIELKTQAAQNAYVQTATDQQKSLTAQLGEIEQEVLRTGDAAARQVVLAPAAGEVMDLKFASPGAVIRPGESIADIVPSDAKLMVEARVQPEDISNVILGQHARVRLTALKYRNHPLLGGTVSYVSADRLTDPATRLPYFSVTIELAPQDLRSAGDVRLQAGMPAEVYIDGVTQTPLQLLLDPVLSTARKAARQM